MWSHGSSFFKPSGQRTRGSSGSPALLKGSEIGLGVVRETKACQLLPVCGGRLATELSLAGAIEPGDLLDQLVAPGRILFPPLIVGHTAPVAQQIVVPVLATADAAVARLEPTDSAFHLLFGTREALPVVTLHPVRPQVGELLPKCSEALLPQLPDPALPPVP